VGAQDRLLDRHVAEIGECGPVQPLVVGEWGPKAHPHRLPRHSLVFVRQIERGVDVSDVRGTLAQHAPCAAGEAGHTILIGGEVFRDGYTGGHGLGVFHPGVGILE